MSVPVATGSEVTATINQASNDQCNHHEEWVVRDTSGFVFMQAHVSRVHGVGYQS